jgi:MFS family permease
MRRIEHPRIKFPVLPEGAAPEVRLLLVARGLRAFGDGLVSLILPVYLLALGYGAFEAGVLASATLAGSALLTLIVGMTAHRASSRVLLMGASVVMLLTGLAFAAPWQDFWPLLMVAFVGTLNPSSGDVSVFLPLEQAQLAHLVSDRDRTRLFARYSFVGSTAAAAGSLCAGFPEIAAALAGLAPKQALQTVFVLYAALGGVVLLLYARLPRTDSSGFTPVPAHPLGPSRRIVLLLAALFSLDSFAGGFVVQSLLALWLFERFGLSLATTGVIFFWAGVLSALSYFAASWISERIGLVNTMVFTHLPANVCLVLVPFAPTLSTAVMLLLVRSALSQMDVPTRTSYVMAVVTPGERAAAASITVVPRSLAAAASPMLAGSLLAASGFGWPLVIGGGLKIVYDLLLLAMFRNVRPPEEGTSRKTP